MGLPILHNMVRSALHRDGEGPSSRRAMAKREAVIEEGLRPETGSSGAEDPMKRWAFARRKMRKAEEEGRERRKKRVEEIVREKERGTRASHAQRGGVGRKLTSE